MTSTKGAYRRARHLNFIPKTHIVERGCLLTSICIHMCCVHVWWWVGVSHLGFSPPLADGVPAPPPRRGGRVPGQEFRVTQHPWVPGTLLETLLGTGRPLGLV